MRCYLGWLVAVATCLGPLLGACSPAAAPGGGGAPPTQATGAPPTQAPPATSAPPTAARPTAGTSTPAPVAATPAGSSGQVSQASQATPPGAPAGGFDEQAVASFYRNNTVKIVVGFSPGGGYDLYARLIGKYLGKYIPGNPTVVVENMPGAGGILATNTIYNASPKDGTIIGSFIGTTILQQLFGDQSIQYDMGKMQFIGAPTGDHYVMEAAKAAGLSSFKDIVGAGAKLLVVGGQGPGVLNYDGALLLRDDLHERLHGHRADDAPVETVSYWTVGIAHVPTLQLETRPPESHAVQAAHKAERRAWFADLGWVDCPIYARDRLPIGAVLPGPAIVEQVDSTTVVHPGQWLEVDGYANLLLRVARDAPPAGARRVAEASRA